MTAHDGEDQRRSAQAQGDPRRGDHGVLSNGYLGARMDEIANRFARRQLRALSGQACSVLGGVLSRAAGPGARTLRVGKHGRVRVAQ
jgi:hypothetical protein